MLTAGSAAYTDDGFLTSKTIGSDVTQYVYSRLGALKSVTLPDTTVIGYILGVGEQRIAKTVNGVVTEKYLWVGNSLLAVYDASDQLLARFEYADGRMPVKMIQGGTVYYLAYDQVGSLRAVLNTSGTVVHEITYDTFGNILSETNSGLLVPFGFAGGLHDRATGLVRFGARDYDADTGRWTAKDPIGFAGCDTNVYAYCAGDPVNRLDSVGSNAVFLIGRNQNGRPASQWTYFRDHAQPWVEDYQSRTGRDAFVYDVRSFNNIQYALTHSGNIDQIFYFGHGAQNLLYLGDTVNALRMRDVNQLDTSNVPPGVEIHLYSCFGGRGDENMAQAFADHFRGYAEGCNDGVSFGLTIGGYDIWPGLVRPDGEGSRFKWFGPRQNDGKPPLTLKPPDTEE